MAQIAQQDNLLIVSKTKASTLEAEVKKKLIECLKVGVLTDVILQTQEDVNTTNYSKIVSYYEDVTDAGAVKYGCVVLVKDVATVIELN